MSTFAERLNRAVTTKKNAVVVGLDPRWSQLPTALRTSDRPHDPSAQAAAFEAFCHRIIDVVAPLVPAVKPQLAFFEELGPSGMAALYSVIGYARRHGLLVILDGKRNDIGSTAEAYARAYLGQHSGWGGDALTVSPYLGHDSLQPFVDAARERDAGIFVLVKTSNPGSGQFQDQPCPTKPLYEVVAAHVEELAAATADASGYGAVGAVVGATYPEQLAELRSQMPHAWLLIPGYGAQGGAAGDVAAAFDAAGRGAIVNSSRAIIFAHARKEYCEQFGEPQWQRAVEAATRAMIDELAAGTPAGKLHG